MLERSYCLSDLEAILWSRLAASEWKGLDWSSQRSLITTNLQYSTLKMWPKIPAVASTIGEPISTTAMSNFAICFRNLRLYFRMVFLPVYHLSTPSATPLRPAQMSGHTTNNYFNFHQQSCWLLGRMSQISCRRERSNKVDIPSPPHFSL